MIPNAAHKNRPQDYKCAKELRQQASLPEQKLWFELRNMRKIWGHKFRRQQPIHPYIVDFICFELKFIIELDGSSHDNTQAQDQYRTNYLIGRGYTVVRYTNDDVMTNVEGVIQDLLNKFKALAAPPPPLTPPARGGERC